jgi:hypothetical protein
MNGEMLMKIQELQYKPDFSKANERMEAWWNRAVLDRPTIQVYAPQNSDKRKPWPQKQHESLRDRWMDVEYAVDCADAGCANCFYGGEAAPIFMPNLGPELLTAAYGAPMNFTETTSWSEPILHEWEDIPKLQMDPNNEYVRAMLDMTRLGLEKGEGKFLTGFTDIHPGGDLAASFRDPQQLCLDLVMEPENVERLLSRIRSSFFDFYKLQEEIFQQSGQPVSTSWLPLWCEGRYYIPSNDFSCMISPDMFRKFFLDEIIEEIEFLDHSIYHLDGPDALRHLDTLLDIPKLDAVQYVYGAGDGPASRWMDIFRKIQMAGKNIWVDIQAEELDIFMENLHPEGVMMNLWVCSVEEAEDILRRVSKWK